LNINKLSGSAFLLSVYVALITSTASAEQANYRGDDAHACNQLSELTITNATSPHRYDKNYRPSRAIDNNLSRSSRWSSKGEERTITFELENQSIVQWVSTAWYRGDVRHAFFDVQTSMDNVNWQTVLYQATAHGTEGMIDFKVEPSRAKHVKIIGRGNSASLWNSIIEVDVMGCVVKDESDPPIEVPPADDDSIVLIKSLFDLEGGAGKLNPYQEQQSLVFDALAAKHVTPNGNGWRHELKMAKSNRRAMYDTSERFSAVITPELSSGSKTIVAQYHGGNTGTLVKIYLSDTDESRHDDSVPGNGIFDVYARLRPEGATRETIVNFGTMRSGESFDLSINNQRGLVTVSAMGKQRTLQVADSNGAYLKFGNYLQAQEPFGGKKYKNSNDWADFYNSAGIVRSVVTFTNVNYQRN